MEDTFNKNMGDMFISYAKRWEEDAQKYRKLKHFLVHLVNKLEHKEYLTEHETNQVVEQINEQLKQLSEL